MTAAIAHLNTDIEEKAQQAESLSEENQKYLDIIIKFSLGGKISGQTVNLLQNKSIRQQFMAMKKGMKGSTNVHELGS